MNRIAAITAAVVVGLCCASARADMAQLYALPENVVVLANANIQDSIDIAAHYAGARGIPDYNLCLLDVPDEYSITIDQYEQVVVPAVRECLENSGTRELALYLVPVYGFPAVITGWGQEVIGFTEKSLDSFLIDLWDEFESDNNPYFGTSEPFLRENENIGYLVTRIDGPTVESAHALIDRAINAGATEPGTWGIAYFDQEPVGDSALDREVISAAGTQVNKMIADTADAFSASGWQVVMDQNDAEFGTAPALESCPDARFYVGWYTPMNYNDAFEWTPGAVGIHIDSFSALDFRQPGSWCSGAIASGITATAGSVWEPYVSGFIDAGRFLTRMASGETSLAEAAWSSITGIRWMMVVFGDPLFSLGRKYPEVVTADETQKPEFAESVDVIEGYDATNDTPVTTGDIHSEEYTNEVIEECAASDCMDKDFIIDDSAVSADSAANDNTPATNKGGGCSISGTPGGPGPVQFTAVFLITLIFVTILCTGALTHAASAAGKRRKN